MPARLHSRECVVARLGEVFREHGFDGAGMAQITAATGWGKGSLYHAFPGGKDEMAAAVLAHVESWFETRVFAPLADQSLPAEQALTVMLDACDEYFRSGNRICLVGVFALTDCRDRFAGAVNDYFRNWRQALTAALIRGGHADAEETAEEALSRIQGALVLARALDDPLCFSREILRLRRKFGAA